MADKQGDLVTDAELRKQLKALGENPGPINDSTRNLWLKKLRSLKEGDKVSVNSSPAGRQTKKHRSLGASPSRRTSKLSMFSSSEEEEKDDEKDSDSNSRPPARGRRSLNNLRRVNRDETAVDQLEEKDTVNNQAPVSTGRPYLTEETGRPKDRRSLPASSRAQGRRSLGRAEPKLDTVDSPSVRNANMDPQFVDDGSPQFIRPRTVPRTSPSKPVSVKPLPGRSDFSDTDDGDDNMKQAKGHGHRNKFVPKAISVVRRRVERVNDSRSNSNEFLEKADTFENHFKQAYSNSTSSVVNSGSDNDEELDIDFATSKSKIIDFICQPVTIVVLGIVLSLILAFLVYFYGGFAVYPLQSLPEKANKEKAKLDKDAMFYLQYMYQHLAENAGRLECGEKVEKDIEGSALTKLAEECFSVKLQKPASNDEVVLKSLQLALKDYSTEFRILLNDRKPERIEKADIPKIKVSTNYAVKPFSCRVKQAALLITKNLFYLALLIGICLLIYYGLKTRWMMDDEDTRQMFVFVDRIIETLRRHHEACQHDQELPPYLPIPHVRDMLIPPFDSGFRILRPVNHMKPDIRSEAASIMTSL